MFPANLVEATFKQVSRAGLWRGGAGGEERPGYREEREEGKRGRAIPAWLEVTAFLPYTGGCQGMGIWVGSIS